MTIDAGCSLLGAAWPSLSAGCSSIGAGCMTAVSSPSFSVSLGTLEKDPGVDLRRVALRSSSSSKKSCRPPTATMK